MATLTFERTSALTDFALDSLTALAHTSATDCEPCDASLVAAADAPVAVASEEGAPTPAVRYWTGIIGVEGEVTGDGRLIERNALRWADLPIPMRYVSADVGAHDGAVVVGTIATINREAGGIIRATGTLDASFATGQEAIHHVEEKLTTGASMDLDDVSFEIRVAAELIAEEQELLDGLMEGEPSGPEFPEADSDGRVTVVEVASDEELRVTTSGRIRAATIVPIPAFASAQIELLPVDYAPDGQAGPATLPAPSDEVDPECGQPGHDPCPEDEGEDSDASSALTLVASGFPAAPPAAWFDAPRLTAPTPLTVTPEGRVYGHLAVWNSCHLSHAHRGCVTPPRSTPDYRYFRVGAVLTAEGAEIPVGRITLDTRHALGHLSPAGALAHYENTGLAVADVAAGEDEHGCWVAGALRPGVTAAQVRSLRASPLSGDWRRIGGRLELVAALAVNLPGFPIPRPSGLVASGAVQSLVASGMVPPRRVTRPGRPGALSLDDLRYLKRLAARERAEEQRAALADLSSAEQLARRVRGSELAMRRHRATRARGGQ